MRCRSFSIEIEGVRRGKVGLPLLSLTSKMKQYVTSRHFSVRMYFFFQKNTCMFILMYGCHILFSLFSLLLLKARSLRWTFYITIEIY